MDVSKPKLRNAAQSWERDIGLISTAETFRNVSFGGVPKLKFQLVPWTSQKWVLQWNHVTEFWWVPEAVLGRNDRLVGWALDPLVGQVYIFHCNPLWFVWLLGPHMSLYHLISYIILKLCHFLTTLFVFYHMILLPKYSFNNPAVI